MKHHPYDLHDLCPEKLEAVHIKNQSRPSSVRLSALRTAKCLFQPRETERWDTINAVKDGIKRGNTIPPLLVYGSARQPIVVDGHHRLAAFHEVYPQEQLIEVLWAEDWDHAVHATVHENQVNQAAVTDRERTRYAWRHLMLDAKRGQLLADGDWKLSKAETAQRHLISVAQVGNFRKELNRLEAALEASQNHPLVQRLRRQLSFNLDLEVVDFATFMRNDPLGLTDTQWSRGANWCIEGFIEGASSSTSVSADEVERQKVNEVKQKLTAALGFDRWAAMGNEAVLSQAIIEVLPSGKREVVWEAMAGELDPAFVTAFAEAVLDGELYDDEDDNLAA